MILNVSATLSDAMLEAVSAYIGPGTLELLASDSTVLVTLGLSDPGAAVDGELVFQVDPAVAVASGQATSARVIAADGRQAFVCDVGDGSSDAVIKLTPDAQIKGGQAGQLDRFRLIMPCQSAPSMMKLPAPARRSARCDTRRMARRSSR